MLVIKAASDDVCTVPRLEKSKSVTAKFVLRFRSLSGSLIDAICQIECVLDMHMVFESLFFLKSTHFLFEQQ